MGDLRSRHLGSVRDHPNPTTPATKRVFLTRTNSPMTATSAMSTPRLMWQAQICRRCR